MISDYLIQGKGSLLTTYLGSLLYFSLPLGHQALFGNDFFAKFKKLFYNGTLSILTLLAHRHIKAYNPSELYRP